MRVTRGRRAGAARRCSSPRTTSPGSTSPSSAACAAGLLHRQVRGRRLAGPRHARQPPAHGLHRPRRGGRRPASVAEEIGRRVGRTARSSCSSPKARPATATASCRSGARCSARPSAAAGTTVDHRPAGGDHLCRHPGHAGRPERPAAHRLVWRHGLRRPFPPDHRAGRDRRGGALRRADPVRPGDRPQAGGRAVLRRGPADDRGHAGRGRSPNLHPGQVFSPPAKEAKGTGGVPGRSVGKAGQEVANRAS